MRDDRFDFLEIGEAAAEPAPGLTEDGAAPPVARATRPGRGRLHLVEILGQAGEALGRFGSPLGVHLDIRGNLYIADSHWDRVQKITPQNEAYGYGQSGAAVGCLRFPADVAVDNRLFIYILERGNHRVTKLTQEGVYLCTIGGQGPGHGQLNSPRSAALDAFNNVFIADTGNRVVQKFDATGRYLEQYHFAEIEGVRAPVGVWVSPLGELLVCDEASGSVIFADLRGRVQGVFAGDQTHRLGGPTAACRDPEGNLWVVDSAYCCILKYAPDGTFLAKLGPNLGPNGALRDPTDIALAPDGDFYVSDTGNHRVLRFGYREQGWWGR